MFKSEIFNTILQILAENLWQDF